jgi:LPS-assembly lipoprotein
MWSSDEKHAAGRNTRLGRRMLLLGALGVAACGFSPVYGPERAASRLEGQISIEPIPGRIGFELRERLKLRFGAAEPDPLYRLQISVDVESTGLAITQDNAITRYNLTGTARYTLDRRADEKRLLEEEGRAYAAYSATTSPYATRIAEKDANVRLVQSLADQIALRLSASAEVWTK